MRLRSVAIPTVVLVVGMLLAALPAPAQQSCESLTSLAIAHVTITLAKAIQPPPDFDVPSLPGRYGTPPGLIAAARLKRRYAPGLID